MKTRFDLTGRLDGIKRTPQGGIRATAYLTRTGVFTYRGAEGKETRELRHPDQIFNADSLESLKFAPLTVGHPGMVTPENYKQLSVGTVIEDVRADGKFVKATILIQDAEACRRVELGAANPSHTDALVELSCGYEVDVRPNVGEYEGEKHDSEQVGHRYNHVALGPPNWGRAGNEVRLRLDAAGNAVGHSYPPAMTPEEKAHLDAVTGERDALKQSLAITTLKADAAENARLEAVALVGARVDPATIPALVAKRVSLENSARKVLGADASFERKDDAGKTVAMTDAEVMTAALVKHDPKFDANDKSADYLRACFDMACKTAVKVDAALADVNGATKPESKIDPTKPEKSRLDLAHENAEKERVIAAQPGPPVGSRTRKA